MKSSPLGPFCCSEFWVGPKPFGPRKRCILPASNSGNAKPSFPPPQSQHPLLDDKEP